MLKKTYFISTCFLLCGMIASAQQEIRFSSQNYLGITEGETGTSFQLQTINGFSYKTWFAGIGTGLDYYYIRSVPVFFSLNKMLYQRKRSFFVSADAGLSFPWRKSDGYSYWGGQKYSQGAYWASGLGYKVGLKGNDALLFSIGYSYKKLNGVSEYTLPCLVPPCPVNKERFDYNLKRISLKAGWMF